MGLCAAAVSDHARLRPASGAPGNLLTRASVLPHLPYCSAGVRHVTRQSPTQLPPARPSPGEPSPAAVAGTAATHLCLPPPVLRLALRLSSACSSQCPPHIHITRAAAWTCAPRRCHPCHSRAGGGTCGRQRHQRPQPWPRHPHHCLRSGLPPGIRGDASPGRRVARCVPCDARLASQRWQQRQAGLLWACCGPP